MAYGFGASMAYSSESPAWFRFDDRIENNKISMFSIFIKGQYIFKSKLNLKVYVSDS